MYKSAATCKKLRKEHTERMISDRITQKMGYHNKNKIYMINVSADQ